MAVAAACVALSAGAQQPIPAESEAQFRGCDVVGWCRFRIESSQYSEETVLRVQPDGIGATTGEQARALRDRLNALLADMIHQYKRIELRNLRAVEGDVHAAKVIVDGADVADDAVVRGLVR